MDGIINLLKPPGMTSADAVAWIRRVLKIKKAGHTGTLDPGVAGVLPLCVGQATKLAEYLTAQEKGYRAEITFGVVTDTQDAFGKVIQQSPSSVSRKEFETVLQRFQGEILQLPPMFSAVRKQGKHLYEYARQGLTVERQPRKVTIADIRLVHWEDGRFPKAIFDIRCSKGTYVRTLCHDIGETLGCGAHMSFLIRTSSGPFTIGHSWTLEEIEENLAAGRKDFILPLAGTLDLPKVYLMPGRVRAFRSGLPSRPTGFQKVEGPIGEGREVQVLFGEQLLGIGIIRNQMLYPRKVLNISEGDHEV